MVLIDELEDADLRFPTDTLVIWKVLWFVWYSYPISLGMRSLSKIVHSMMLLYTCTCAKIWTTNIAKIYAISKKGRTLLTNFQFKDPSPPQTPAQPSMFFTCSGYCSMRAKSHRKKKIRRSSKWFASRSTLCHLYMTQRPWDNLDYIKFKVNFRCYYWGK